MFSKGYVKLPKDETDLCSCKWSLHICIPNSHHTTGTISMCADCDIEELSSLQCHMEDRLHKFLFLGKRTGGGDGVNLWQVRDHSVFVPLQRTPHITAYCNPLAHESHSEGLAFDPCSIGHDSKVLPFPVSICVTEITCTTTRTEMRSGRLRDNGGLQYRSCLKMHRHWKTLQARYQCQGVHVSRIAIQQCVQTAR